MTRSRAVHVVAEAVVPDDCGHCLVGDVEIFVPLKGLIDVEGELQKLERERIKLENELARVTGKLNNETFLSKAPETVVAKERAKENELQGRLEKNAESTARVQKLR
jgi:valyl-tRNA synthetase